MKCPTCNRTLDFLECNKCHQYKDVAEFPFQPLNRNRMGRSCWCWDCEAIDMGIRKEDHPDWPKEACK